MNALAEQWIRLTRSECLDHKSSRPAKALAMTALDLVAQPAELQKAKEEFVRT